MNLGLPLGTLYQIAAPKADAARKEIAERDEAGELILASTVKEVLARTKKGAAAEQEATEDEAEDKAGETSKDEAKQPVASRSNGVDNDASKRERGGYYEATEGEQPGDAKAVNEAGGKIVADQQTEGTEKAASHDAPRAIGATEEATEAEAEQQLVDNNEEHHQPEQPVEPAGTNDPYKRYRRPDGRIDHGLKNFDEGIGILCSVGLSSDTFKIPHNLPSEMAAEQLKKIDEASASLSGLRARIAVVVGGAAVAPSPAKSGKANGRRKPAVKELDLEALLKVNWKRLETSAELDAHIERIRRARNVYSGRDRQDIFATVDRIVARMRIRLAELSRAEKARGLIPVNSYDDKNVQFQNEYGQKA